MNITSDTVYNYEPGDVRPADYVTPPGTWEAFITDMAHAAVTMPRADVRRLIKPTVPIPPIPGTRPGVPATIQDVINLARPYIGADNNFAGFRGSAAGYSAASRNTMGNGYGV